MITCSRCGHEYEDALKLALDGRPVCPSCMYELVATKTADGKSVQPKNAQEPKFFHFDTDVYERRIGLAVGPLKKLNAAWLTERIREAWLDLGEGHVELDDADETVLADALRIQTDDGIVIQIVRIPGFDPGSPRDHAVLAHETFHLVCEALKDLGVPHDDHEEAHAYLFEHVYRRFLEFLLGRGHENH